MDNVPRTERDIQIEAVIKSNLVSFGIETDVISKIVGNLTADLIDLLDNFEIANLVETETYVD